MQRHEEEEEEEVCIRPALISKSIPFIRPTEQPETKEMITSVLVNEFMLS